MKRFPKSWTARAVFLFLALGIWCALPALGQQASSTQGQPAPTADQPMPSVLAHPPAHPADRKLLPLPPATPQGIPMSLSQAVALGVANNEDQYVTVNAAESFEYGIIQNKGIFDPLVSAAVGRSHAELPAASVVQAGLFDDTTFSGNVSQLTPWGGTVQLGFTGDRETTNNQFVDLNPSYSGGVSFSFNQPLLRSFGKQPTVWLIMIAKNSRDSYYQTLVRTVQSTVNNVEQAYWDLVYALQNLEVKRESLRIAQDLNRITQIKINVGSLAPIEIVQTEVGIATAEQDIITAEGLIGDAQDRLKRQLNFTGPDVVGIPILPTDQLSTDRVKIELEAAMTDALGRRPEVLAASYTVASDLVRYDYYRNQLLPQLTATGSYGTKGIAGLSIDPTTGQVITNSNFSDAFRDVLDRKNKSWTLGLNLSYPIMNRSAKGAAGVARYTMESDKANLTVTKENVIVEVRTDARAIDTAARTIDAAVKGRELAERNLDAEKKKFDNGMSTTFQVNQIQLALSSARTLEQQALAVYRKAVAQYHFAIADNLEWKGIKVEGLPDSAPPVTEKSAPLPDMKPPAPAK
jgi:outer membrane protein